MAARALAGAANGSRRSVRAAVALGGGLALWLAFPPFDLWWLAGAGPAALAWTVRDQRKRWAGLLGLLLGLAFMLPLLQWSGVFVGALPWVALSVLQATFYSGLGVVVSRVLRLRGWPLWVAAAWATAELARSSVPFGGFPWGRLAFSQAASPFGRLAAIGGAPIVTFAVALAGLLVLAVVRTAVGDAAGAHRRPTRSTVLRAVALVAVLATVTLRPAPPGADTAERATRVVSVVQGDVPQEGLDFNAERRAVLDNHVEETLRIAEDVAAGKVQQPDLVLWPENASDIDPLLDADASARIGRAVSAVGVPTLVGAVLDGPGRSLRNAGIVWDPERGPERRT